MSSKVKKKQINGSSMREVKPRFRFSEFEKYGNWKEEFGGRLFDQISNKNHNSDLPILAITQEHGAIPRDQIDYRVSVTDKSIESYKVVEVGDFIISLRSFQGGIEYSKYKGLCSPAYVILRKKGNQVDEFFTQYFKTDQFIKDLNKDIEGIRDGKMVNYRQFSDLCISVPPILDEQKKIADCLTSLDDLIALEEKKLDVLKDHKKGLMQELFPVEGETLPKLRFPEFRNSSEWDEMKVEKLFHLQDGYSFSSSDFVDPSDNTIQVIRITDINNQNKNESKVYIPKSLIETLRLKKFMIEKGDLLLSLTGAAGFNFFLWNSKPALINQRTMKITLKDDKNMALRSLLSPQVHDKINTHGSGQNNNLSKELLKTVKLFVPKPNEQRLISDFISTIDDIIASQSQKLDALRDHKKGLMQQLFPTLEEVEA